MDTTVKSNQTASHQLHGFVAVCVIFIVLDTFFGILRVVARLQVKSASLGWDDIILVPAYILAIASAATGIVIAHIERGSYPSDSAIINPTQFSSALKAIYAITQLHFAAIALPRISLLFFYARVFAYPTLQIWSYTVMAVVIASWLAFAFASAFACTPVQSFWNMTVPGSCIGLDAFYRTIPPINIVTDLAIMALPIKPLMTLDTSKSKKLALFCIFLTGSIGVIACCVRWSVFLRQHAFPPKPSVTGPFITWVVVEASMYFIAACLPSIGPLLRGVVQRHNTSPYSEYTSNGTATRTMNRTSGMPIQQDRPQLQRTTSSVAHLVRTDSGTYQLKQDIDLVERG